MTTRLARSIASRSRPQSGGRSAIMLPDDAAMCLALVGHYRLKQSTKRGARMSGQRRGRVIAMSTGEMDAFLGQERTCRLATVGAGGPHVSPVWFVWAGGALW